MVGGGITGAGVALDAASRGLRTALVERGDFASGTSSKSSKLVHGGLRYLQQREVRLVYEALYERQRALENAPHLVRILPFLVPLTTHGGVIDRRLARLLGSALWAYDLSGGLRIGKRHHRIDVDTAIAHMPTLARDRLAGAYVYYDAQADDARLTLTIARTAAAEGAAIANHAPVRASAEGRRPRRRRARIEADGDEVDVRARVVVNAAGVWSDDVRALDEGTQPAVDPSGQGHPHHRCRGRRCATTSPPSSPCPATSAWSSSCRGVTPPTSARPTPTYDGPLDDPPCTPDDVDYLLAALNGITEEKLTADDVVGTWAGLRPLLRTGRSARTADLSRRHTVGVSPGGVVTVTGGKLTTYRRMAADAVDAAFDGLDEPKRPSRTKHLRLFGGEGIAPPEAALEPSTHEHLIGRYGTEAEVVRALTVDRARPRRSARPRPAVPPRRGDVRGAPRDGAHARRRALAAHAGAAARARRVGRRGGDGGRAARARPRVVRHRTRRAGRRVPRRGRRRAGRDLVSPRS